MNDNKFNELQQHHQLRIEEIKKYQASKKEVKFQPFKSRIFNYFKYLMIIVWLKIKNHLLDKRYNYLLERKKRFTLSMVGESKIKVFLSKLNRIVFLRIVGIIIIFPFYWMVITSFKTFRDIDPSFKETLWPKHWSLEAYKELFQFIDQKGQVKQISFGRYFWNSFYISMLLTVGQMSLSLSGGFAIFNWRTKLNSWFMILMFSLIMVPGEALIMGRYKFAHILSLKDNVLALILPFLGNVYTVYLISNALVSSTTDLKKASKVDGLSTFKYFYKISIPTIKSVIITSMILAFISSWNSTLWPIMIMNPDGKHATIPMLLYGLMRIEGMHINPELYGDIVDPINFKMAASVISILPIMIIFIIFNKPIIKGMSNRGFKNNQKK